MKPVMHVVLAPMQLKPGVDEATLLAASEAFQENFVSKQQGILRRTLLKDGRGGYADLVFFESEQHFQRVLPPVAVDQTRMVLSNPAEAMRSPSALKTA